MQHPLSIVILFTMFAVFQNPSVSASGVEENEPTAIATYSKAAKKGDADAQYNLGMCYENGKSVDQDDDKAVKWYKKAAKQGYAKAQYRLGLYYASGVGVVKDEKKAFEWYQKAADQGYANAQNNLGLCYELGQGIVKDEKKAFEWYQKAADQEYVKAQNNLGICYEYGEGVVKDEKKAFEWYHKAADQGYVKAQNNLGLCYELGQGVVKDEKKAFEWYHKAADQGYAKAQYNLGVCYKYGQGVVKDEKKAFEWYQKAAKQEYADAQNNLGWMYENGLGISKDEEEAAKWYTKAAEQGNAYGQYNLAWMCENGCGVHQNQNEANKWYAAALKQGHGDKQEIEALLKEDSTANYYRLGRLYEHGRGVNKDEGEAARWYSKAAKKGHEKSRARLEAINKNMSTPEMPTQPPIKIRKVETVSISDESLTSFIDALLFEKDLIRTQLKKNTTDYAIHYKLASLYEQISDLSSFPNLKSKYFEKAIKGYQIAAEHDCQEAQAALCTLRDKGAYSVLDSGAMGWYKKAVAQAGLNFEDFISVLTHTIINNSNTVNSIIFPLKLSAISFINMDDDRYLPTAIEWGGLATPQELNHIYKPLYNPNKYGKYEDAIMAVDPSGDGDDETAYCVAKRNGDLYFITALGGFAGGYEEKLKHRVGNSPEIVAKIADIAKTHKVNYVLIEKNNDNSYASLLKQQLKEEIEVIKWHHSQKKEKRIVETFKPLLDNHQLVIDRKVLQDDFESKPSNDITYKFFYQLTHMTLDEECWPTKRNALYHDDRLDAAAMAIKHLRVRKEKLKDSEYVHEIVR